MKRLFNTYIKFLYVVIALGIIILFGPNILGFFLDGTTVDAYRIDNAEFDKVTFTEVAPRNELKAKALSIPEFAFSYHAIKPGNGTIIAIRKFYDEIIMLDEERYEKITIWLPEYKDGTYNLEQNKSIVAFYSRGGSAWPASDCSTKIEGGTFTIKGNNLSTNLKFKCTNPMGLTKEANRNIEILDTYHLKSITSDKINFWIGKPGAEHPYKETYR